MDSRPGCKMLFPMVVQLGIIVLSILSIALAAPESDLLHTLPGQTQNSTFKQYSGYITVDEEHGKALFYYFVETQTDPQSRPLALWLTGGPGCSSLGYGAFMEHGPFKPRGHNDELLWTNKYSWNMETNMIYLESPIGVGFSYSNSSSDYQYYNDAMTAQDNLAFLLNWFEKFPEYRSVDFYITGESYGGHYVPQLATLVLNHNKNPNIKPVKLEGIAMGNPFVDIEISINNDEFFWSHGLISDETYRLAQSVCNNSRRWVESYVLNNLSKTCQNVFSKVQSETGNINLEDVTLGLCLNGGGSQTTGSGKPRKFQHKIEHTFNKIDPCIDFKINQYLNKQEVKKSLHANTSLYWEACSGKLHYDQKNRGINVIPVLSDLLKAGLRITLYSGDQDSKVPFTATRTIANNLAKELNLYTVIPYGPWYDNKQVAGWTQSYGHTVKGKNESILTYATVRGGGHEVPYTNPSEALNLYRAFIRALPLPSS